MVRRLYGTTRCRAENRAGLRHAAEQRDVIKWILRKQRRDQCLLELCSSAQRERGSVVRHLCRKQRQRKEEQAVDEVREEAVSLAGRNTGWST
jgi:hypothetical protein